MDLYNCNECGKGFPSQSKLKVHVENKHIISHHLSDYFDLTGKTLRKVNDQVVESSHSKVRKFFDAHPNYNHKNKTSEASGDATLAGIVHFNTNSI